MFGFANGVGEPSPADDVDDDEDDAQDKRGTRRPQFDFGRERLKGKEYEID